VHLAVINNKTLIITNRLRHTVSATPETPGGYISHRIFIANCCDPGGNGSICAGCREFVGAEGNYWKPPHPWPRRAEPGGVTTALRYGVHVDQSTTSRICCDWTSRRSTSLRRGA